MTERDVSPARLQLRDEVAAHLRGAILTGGVEPGAFLRLQPLVASLGISMTPVREAVLMLSQEGLLIQEPNRGFRVASLRPEDIIDVYRVNAWVAGELAARAAVNVGNEELARIQELLAELHGLPENGLDEAGAHRAEILNGEIHAAIYTAAQSPRLRWFIDTASRFVPRGFWPTVNDWLAHNRHGHDLVVVALARRDEQGSRVAMAEHIAAAGALLARRFETHVDNA